MVFWWLSRMAFHTGLRFLKVLGLWVLVGGVIVGLRVV